MRHDKVEQIDVVISQFALQTLQHEELFLLLSEHLPKELIFEREALVSRL